MAVSDAKKKANSKWDAANMATLACKVKKSQAESFRQYCADNGETVNSVLQSYILTCISEKCVHPTESPTSDFRPLVVSEDVARVNAHTEATGEATEEFMHRAITDTIDRDSTLIKMGISPVKKKSE